MPSFSNSNDSFESNDSNNASNATTTVSQRAPNNNPVQVDEEDPVRRRLADGFIIVPTASGLQMLFTPQNQAQKPWGRFLRTRKNAFSLLRPKDTRTNFYFLCISPELKVATNSNSNNATTVIVTGAVLALLVPYRSRDMVITQIKQAAADGVKNYIERGRQRNTSRFKTLFKLLSESTRQPVEWPSGPIRVKVNINFERDGFERAHLMPVRGRNGLHITQNGYELTVLTSKYINALTDLSAFNVFSYSKPFNEQIARIFNAKIAALNLVPKTHFAKCLRDVIPEEYLNGTFLMAVKNAWLWSFICGMVYYCKLSRESFLFFPGSKKTSDLLPYAKFNINADIKHLQAKKAELSEFIDLFRNRSSLAPSAFCRERGRMITVLQNIIGYQQLIFAWVYVYITLLQLNPGILLFFMELEPTHPKVYDFIPEHFYTQNAFCESSQNQAGPVAHRDQSADELDNHASLYNGYDLAKQLSDFRQLMRAILEDVASIQRSLVNGWLANTVFDPNPNRLSDLSSLLKAKDKVVRCIENFIAQRNALNMTLESETTSLSYLLAEITGLPEYNTLPECTVLNEAVLNAAVFYCELNLFVKDFSGGFYLLYEELLEQTSTQLSNNTQQDLPACLYYNPFIFPVSTFTKPQVEQLIQWKLAGINAADVLSFMEDGLSTPDSQRNVAWAVSVISLIYGKNQGISFQKVCFPNIDRAEPCDTPEKRLALEKIFRVFAQNIIKQTSVKENVSFAKPSRQTQQSNQTHSIPVRQTGVESTSEDESSVSPDGQVPTDELNFSTLSIPTNQRFLEIFFVQTESQTSQQRKDLEIMLKGALQTPPTFVQSLEFPNMDPSKLKDVRLKRERFESIWQERSASVSPSDPSSGTSTPPLSQPGTSSSSDEPQN